MRTDWPNGAQVAISLTFDVDAETGWLGEDPAYAGRLSSLSEARFGITRGLPRILDTLARHDVPGTFYVPGHTAELHPDAIRRIADAGHEIGHHGHMHLRSDAIGDAAQREEIERGLEALAPIATPTGYRSPSWELTPYTLELLTEHGGFTYDSSLMGDDRPYRLNDQLVELPVHWSLDDWPHLHWKPGRGDAFTSPQAFLDTWLREFESALADRRHVTYTMHPEVIGRGYRARLLEALITTVTERADVWFATHADVAAFVTS